MMKPSDRIFPVPGAFGLGKLSALPESCKLVD